MGLLGDAFKYAWDNISGRQQNIDNQKYSYEMYKRQRDDNRHDALIHFITIFLIINILLTT